MTRDLDIAAETVGNGISTWQGREVDLHPAISRLVAKALSRTQLKEPVTDEVIDQLVTYLCQSSARLEESLALMPPRQKPRHLQSRAATAGLPSSHVTTQP